MEPNDAFQLLPVASVAVTARGCVPAAAILLTAHGAVNKAEGNVVPTALHTRQDCNMTGRRFIVT